MSWRERIYLDMALDNKVKGPVKFARSIRLPEKKCLIYLIVYKFDRKTLIKLGRSSRIVDRLSLHEKGSPVDFHKVYISNLLDNDVAVKAEHILKNLLSEYKLNRRDEIFTVDENLELNLKTCIEHLGLNLMELGWPIIGKKLSRMNSSSMESLGNLSMLVRVH